MNSPTNGQRAVPRSGGAESATAVPELGKLETRLTCSLGLCSAGPEPGLLLEPTTLGRSRTADPAREAEDTLSTRTPRTTWPDPSDDPTRLLFTPRNHLGTNRLKTNKQEWLKMITAFFLTLLAACSVNSKKLKSWHISPASEHLWEMETAQWRRHQKDDQKDILSLSETRDGGNCPAHLLQACGNTSPLWQITHYSRPTIKWLICLN